MEYDCFIGDKDPFVTPKFPEQDAVLYSKAKVHRFSGQHHLPRQLTPDDRAFLQEFFAPKTLDWKKVVAVTMIVGLAAWAVHKKLTNH